MNAAVPEPSLSALAWPCAKRNLSPGEIDSGHQFGKSLNKFLQYKEYEVSLLLLRAEELLHQNNRELPELGNVISLSRMKSLKLVSAKREARFGSEGVWT